MQRNVLGLNLLLALAACGNDNGGPILDLGTADQTGDAGACLEATFAALHGLLSSERCANDSCHAGPGVFISGMLDLSGTPADVHRRLVGVATNDAEGVVQYPFRVEANSPSTSYLLHMIESDNPVGSIEGRMPPGSTLEDCEIDAFTSWIETGAPDAQ